MTSFRIAVIDASAAGRLTAVRTGEEPARGPVLAALDGGGRPAAALAGEPAAGAFRIEALLTSADDGGALAAVLDHVRAVRPQTAVELAVDPAPESDRLRAALTAAGFLPVLEQVHYEGALAARPAGRPRPVAAPAAGDALGALEAVWAGEPPAGRAPVDALERLLLDATRDDGCTDTALWRVAYDDDGGVVGVALAQRMHDGARTGALLYLGVVPGRRGGGVGGALHRSALAALHAAGARRYADATEPGNAPMRRLLERAGCVPAGCSRLFRAPPLAPPPELLRAGDVVAHLEGRGHACHPGRPLRVVARRGPARAALVLHRDRAAGTLEVRAGAGRHVLPLDARGRVRRSALDLAIAELLTAVCGPGAARRRLLAVPIARASAHSVARPM